METESEDIHVNHRSFTKAAIQGLAPRTFYQELAQENSLYGFLQTYLAQTFENDEKFRNEMMNVLLEHSPGVIPEFETELLQDLCESLSYFLEYTKPWKTQNQ
ncbi:MAG: hypothetical protein IPM69_07100 [Ignavibacteria bacterium]|nr:hypothetical protein [Ignavibacteria bacterium]